MGKNKAIDLITPIIIFFVALFLYTKIVGPIPFTVNNTNTNTTDLFQTQGTGSASAAPDTAVINLGITSEASTVKSAQDEANEISTNLIKSLKEQGINEKDIKTTNYSINPNYNFTGESQKINGYSVNQTFEVEAPIEKTNQIVDSATKAGANNVGNISFKLNDKKQIELQNMARKEAVDAAKSSAEGLAKASGIKLGKIINVIENINGIKPIPIALDAKTTQEEEIGNSTQITPGQSNVEITVMLTYQTN